LKYFAKYFETKKSLVHLLVDAWAWQLQQSPTPLESLGSGPDGVLLSVDHFTAVAGYQVAGSNHQSGIIFNTRSWIGK
jgi:hypothetical protein